MRRSVLVGTLGLFVTSIACQTGVEGQAPAPFIVQSPTIRTGVMMPRDQTPDGRNLSPALTWEDLPAGTAQIAIICQDHGAGSPPPWVHWILYNIPSAAGGVPEGVPFDPTEPMPTQIAGATHGNNSWGLPMYRGPAPPGTSLHHYHFAVFALDAELDLPAGLTRDELIEAMEGHVLGEGAIVPIYRRIPMPEPADRSGGPRERSIPTGADP